MRRMSRREFNRLALMGIGAFVVSECASPGKQPTPEAGSTPTPTSRATSAPMTAPTQAAPKPTALPTQPRTSLHIDSSNADVWAWSRRVSGTGEGCGSVSIQGGRQAVTTTPAGGPFTADVPLKAGANVLQAVCADAGSGVGSNQVVYDVRLEDRPRAVASVRIQGSAVVLDGGKSQPSEGSRSPIASYSWSARAGNSAATLEGSKSGQKVTFQAPKTDGEYYFTLTVKDQAGMHDQSTTYFVVEGAKAMVPDFATENPVWVERAVVYGTVPSKFGNEGFRSISARLPYLADLGVSALWLAPVFVSPSGDYGYAVKDYFNLNPDYGTKDHFRALIQKAHSLGIRVLMDFVPNHTSDEHPYFQDRKEHGKSSPYWDFYEHEPDPNYPTYVTGENLPEPTYDEDGKYNYYFDWTNLPNLNYDNPEVRRFMTEAFAYWVREFDVDGFRVDACWGERQRRPDYWPEWRQELKRIKPDLMLLAEAGARDPYYFTHGFDVAYDWTDDLGHPAWEKVWTARYLLTAQLNDALTNFGQGFGPDALIFRFLNNNDTGDRFISQYGLGMTKVATAMLLTLPGVPELFTGDEIGAEYSPYYDQNPLDWSHDRYHLRPYHQKLIHLRLDMPSLHSRQWTPVKVEPVDKVYAYLRWAGDDRDAVLVLLNFSEDKVTAKLDVPRQFQSLVSGGSMRDLLNDEDVRASSHLEVAMDGLTARILVAKE